MKRPPLRSLLLYGALALVLAASAWTHLQRRQDDVPELAEARLAPRAALPKREEGELPESVNSQAGPADALAPIFNLFAAADWDAPVAPPPPPPVMQAAAPPQAPALPFEYLGRTEVVGEAGAMLIHLRRGSEMFSVRAGDSIDAQYRLDQVGEDALHISYLPLSSKQTLIITGSR
ncbi:hypothetical protein [Pseudoduganella violacea]|uniref:Secretion system X translation initiation factor n=1 Tax=Pseudoduganella violacea TaxID=1715466 RepID=A0A7W5FSY1_9BURK|nr:hypothetical protein [Pseudoduganella violacea]MBB3118235.1 hypothetical protein [Pseudoduganella violacea]